MFHSLDMLDFIITQVQGREIREGLEVLNPVDEIVVEIEFYERWRETGVYSRDLVVS